MVDRRILLGVTLTAMLLGAPLVGGAEEAGKVPRVGWLSTSSSGPFEVAFREGLRALGYVEGKNIAIEWRFAEGQFERLAPMAAELVNLKVDVIVAGGTSATFAAKRATSTIPIVMPGISRDPIEAGLVASLGRPGGNITGLTRIAPEVTGKRLQMLKEVMPTVSRVAILWHPAAESAPALEMREGRNAAAILRIQLQSLEVRRPADFDPAFQAMVRERADALVILHDGLTFTHRRRLVDLAAKQRLPAMYETADWTDAGGLMAYGPKYSDLYRRAATYVVKILKGTKPADLPVEQPIKFELVINMKTAKALGFTIPPSLLRQADQLVE